MEITRKSDGKYLMECCADEILVVNTLLVSHVFLFKLHGTDGAIEKHLCCAAENMARSIADTVVEIGNTITPEERKRCLSCPSICSNGPEACRMKSEQEQSNAGDIQ